MMERIALHALHRADEFTLRQTHVILWAYCRHGAELPLRVRELFKAFRQRVLDALDPLDNSPIVAAVMWTYAKAGCADAELCARTADAFCALDSRAKIPQGTTHSLTLLTYSLGLAGHRHALQSCDQARGHTFSAATWSRGRKS